MGKHVGLIDPREALDRRTIEAHAFGERSLELGRRDGHRLQKAENIGEPHTDKSHIALFDRPQYKLGLLVHPAKSAVQDVTAGLRGGQAVLLVLGLLSRCAHLLLAS
jgi:hypothetical protein